MVGASKDIIDTAVPPTAPTVTYAAMSLPSIDAIKHESDVLDIHERVPHMMTLVWLVAE